MTMQHPNEPKMEVLLKMKEELVAKVKTNPDDKDSADKLEAITSQIKRNS